MPPALLRSQFDALEEPGPDEDPIPVAIDARPHEIVARIVSALNA
jgi:gluconate kinase